MRPARTLGLVLVAASSLVLSKPALAQHFHGGGAHFGGGFHGGGFGYHGGYWGHGGYGFGVGFGWPVYPYYYGYYGTPYWPPAYSYSYSCAPYPYYPYPPPPYGYRC